MAERTDHREKAAFLRGGGATGELIAHFDWSATSLGPLANWPQCLKTAAAIMLRAPMPMMLLWGEDGVVLYNDPCSPLLGKRHPKGLGAKVMDVFPEGARFSTETLNAGLSGRPLSFRDRPLVVFRNGVVEEAWFDVDTVPVLDETGRPAGVLVISKETTGRVIAEQTAEVDRERRRRMFEQAPGFICLLRGPELVVEYCNEAHKRLFGGGDIEGLPYREAFGHLAADLRAPVLEHTFTHAERFVSRAQSVIVPRPDGTAVEHFLDLVLEPVTDEEGRVTHLFFQGFDVTEQVRAQAAAEESERRLSAAITIARLGAFEWDLVTQNATLDERAREIFGFAPDEELAVGDVTARIAPEDIGRLQSEHFTHNRAERSRREYEYHIRRPDGSIRVIAAVSDTVLGADGELQRIVGVFDDVTEQRAAERRQRMLINELNHRVKNTLATVQSIAAQTLRSAPDLGVARDSFEARLVALAAAHDLLTAQNWNGAQLADVAATAMAPFETVQRPQISRSGPPVWLSAQRALALSLALHELATNAAKYGALTTPAGRVEIRWELRGTRLSLCWREAGGPAVRPPSRAGFGTRLLQRGLAHELHGDVQTHYSPEGVRCEIACEVEDAPASPEPAVAGI